MPELPEVETIVRDLRTQLPGAVITRVTVQQPDILGTSSVPRFQRALRNRRIECVERRAKNIVLSLDNGGTLVVHLGMTGRLAAEPSRPADMQHVALQFSLGDGRTLYYDDVRRFGHIEYYAPGQWQLRAAEFGIEPLSTDFTAARLYELTRLSSSPIRNWLLDPYRVAGIGNIYANEALYRARIRPTRRANTITRAQAAALRDTLLAVLLEAIVRRGTTLSNYRDASGAEGEFRPLLQVYGREGQPCLCCATAIKRIVLSNRSAYYCPKCQR